jgi:hypothetical protein
MQKTIKKEATPFYDLNVERGCLNINPALCRSKDAVVKQD